MTLALLLAAAAATAMGTAALHTARGLRRQIAGLRAELAGLAVPGRERAATVPGARPTPAAEIRAAVADALAEERERELAEARAFWAAQEARDVTGATAAADAHSLLGGLSGLGDDSLDALLDDHRADFQLYVPRQADFAGLEPSLGDPEAAPAGQDAFDPAAETADLARVSEAAGTPDLSGIADTAEAEHGADPVESAELAAARRRHPSHPDFSPAPVITDHERTVGRLAELADAGVPLTDVRPGPLGTLDVYVFADGTTICMTPGHRETADRLADALRAGPPPVLLGSSGVSGAYALTFGCGEENVYVLADRVIASL
ncbi:hypothetical protein [Streptomyces sp. NPDC018031]|uniref:hypothetical protein n=1 Tax=Streptomyces sp. NPDC018031 TaxID=3365033 RepID=UPI00379E87CD